jgi:hypothetical protein
LGESLKALHTARRDWRGIFSVVLIFVVALSFVGYFLSAYAVQQQAQTAQKQLSDEVSAKLSNDIGALNPILTVKVYDSSGHLYATRVEKHDLLTNIFINWLGTLVLQASSHTISATSIGGTAVSLCSATLGASSGCNWNYLYGGGNVAGAYIEVGTGTVPAARTDTALGAPYQAPPTKISSVVYDPNTGNITIGGNIVAQTAATISESGLIIEWLPSNTATQFLFAHDVFTGIAVSAGSTIAVQYTIELLNTGFTNNFGEFFACVLQSIVVGSGGGPAGVSGATDVSGTARNLGCYLNFSVSNGGQNIASNQPWAAFGTGTTSPARSQYTLATPSSTCTNTPTSPAASNNGVASSIFNVNQIKITTSLVCTSAQTISEAGLFDQISYNSNLYTFMLWRATFTGVSVPANTALTITFVITVN